MSSSIAEQYQNDGYIIAKGLYSALEMEDWKTRIVKRLEEKGWANDPSGVSVWMVDDLDAFFTEKMTEPKIINILKEVIGPNIEFLSVKPVFKNSSTRFGSPWHQDWAYWKGSHKVSVWIALDKATMTNGCLKIIPGSHGRVIEADSVKEKIGFDHRIDESKLENFESKALEVDPGDVVIFHDLTLHASFENTDGADRWSFISTYRDGSVVDDSPIWKNSLVASGVSVNVAKAS
ncbi:phytanoyl-CoA dioxygenase family protein [Rubellicoccus peritrichatus]|uniref:Phytanoyl-CoA dioxygenase family protein n=1 Tax=Rubellicoccus peritrichatus TaxID=3080537 RepID=A0AAQ3LJL4_9BACT|nr:phytanoyl-CoA dioxygenase family protein [Puniceicoccus sp. CR14]WOO43414.1 phytanoyl-CoA dioxygenase family protein [Puniceicoccus sp. CR14]